METFSDLEESLSRDSTTSESEAVKHVEKKKAYCRRKKEKGKMTRKYTGNTAKWKKKKKKDYVFFKDVVLLPKPDISSVPMWDAFPTIGKRKYIGNTAKGKKKDYCIF